MARQAMEGERYEWSCFAAQQAAEKAVKAVHRKLGFQSRGNSVAELLEKTPDSTDVPARLVEAAKALDKNYVQTRYPHCFDSGAPADFYTHDEANDAIEKATQIIEFCRDQVD
jgi:HEPN domain-containing protein